MTPVLPSRWRVGIGGGGGGDVWGHSEVFLCCLSRRVDEWN